MIPVYDEYNLLVTKKSDSTTITEKIGLKNVSTTITGLDNVLYEVLSGNTIQSIDFTVEEVGGSNSLSITDATPSYVEHQGDRQYKLVFEKSTELGVGETFILKSADVTAIKVSYKVNFANAIIGSTDTFIDIGSAQFTIDRNYELDQYDEVKPSITLYFNIV
ncbi:hypothetical protein DRN58_04100 [Thermococci archaeon]|nr:MAG: hypothetical protein DRN58_04100 [Thermococci archaeon]